ncbi:MAG: arylesterase [Saprospiraceae bacterium]|nr:arylesterase [Saprospiraceae bacterium]
MNNIPGYSRWCIFLITALLAGCQPAENSDQRANPKQEVENPDPSTDSRNKKDRIYVVFFGNSLTAGYGLEESESFTALVQERTDSLGWPVEIINAGLSGETTSNGKNRIDWVLRQPIDIFVLELGGNDALRGLDVTNVRQNLEAIIKKVRQKSPDTRIVIAGMEAPPNMGPDYVQAFESIYPELAEKYDTELIPRFLKDVGGVPELNMEDRIHPNAEGQKILFRNVWEVLKPVIQNEMKSTDGYSGSN